MAIDTIFTINRSNCFHDLVNTKRKSTYFDILLVQSINFPYSLCTLRFVHKLSMIKHLRYYQLLAQQCNLRKSIVSRPLLTRPQLTSVPLSLSSSRSRPSSIVMKTIIGKNSSGADDLLLFAGINRALILGRACGTSVLSPGEYLITGSQPLRNPAAETVVYCTVRPAHRALYNNKNVLYCHQSQYTIFRFTKYTQQG